VGVPVGALENVRFSFPDLNELPAEASLAEARRQALLHRADILGVLAEYAASQSALQLEIAKQYPDVHLSPGYEFDQGDNKWSLGLSLTLPVFNHNQGAIAEAEAKRRAIAARFNALQARVLGEIDQAMAGYHLARAKQADAEALLGRLRQQEKAAQAIFGAGEISRGDLNALDLQLSSAALARLEALAKSQQAFGQLEDALQSPLGVPAAIEQEPSRATFTGKGNSLP
jgi:outer membrane protein, heavy metal efflux system